MTGNPSTGCDRVLSPPLHLGWLLDVPKDNDKQVPVNLRGEGLTAHMAIIAQSGSGKSFLLGRLLEELASKTLARVLILDPNSDFGQFGAVAEEPWKFADEPRDVFRRRWDQVHFRNLTKRSKDTLPEAMSVSLFPISLSWPDLSLDEKARLLGISLYAHPEEYTVFRDLDTARGLCERATYGPYTLQRWSERVDGLITIEELGGGPASLTDWPTGGLARNTASLSTIYNVGHRIDRLLRYGIWDKDPVPLQEHVTDLSRTGGHARIVSLDLGSLDEPEQRFLVSAAALGSLWEGARQSWTAALSAPRSGDERCPIFVVIDEAHNIAPEEPSTDLAQETVDILVRIAMEGRKYGLFLILVTQRPSRINSNLLSQCDNLCLMKMSNPADVRLVEQRFGFVPSGWAKRALDFKKGQMLLSGGFVERPVYAMGAPRRTVEGGRSLRDEVWLRDPYPAPSTASGG